MQIWLGCEKHEECTNEKEKNTKNSMDRKQKTRNGKQTHTIERS